MINILFGGNKKVFDGILLCLLSIMKYCKEQLNVYILTADLTEISDQYKPLSKDQTQFLNQTIKKINPESNVKLIELKNNFNNWVLNSSNKLSSYTPFAFLRLFADKIDNLPEKILYLDCDIMFNGNIEELFKTDISNHEIAVVLDRYGRFFINPSYFNSGMLLMNMKKIKETNLLEKVRNLCLNKKMSFPDQTALNKLCKNKLYLPRRFNEQGKLKADTVVQHFSKRIKWFPIFKTINIKPWQIEEVQKQYKINSYNDIYNEYLNLKNNLNNL